MNLALSEMNLEPNSPWKKLSSKEQSHIFQNLWVKLVNPDLENVGVSGTETLTFS